MAGHSHWSQIKRQKGANDAKRGQMFSKLAREISVAARMGGGDPSMNPRLRSAIDAAREISVPNDTIDRAVKKGTGELGGGALEEITYEGFGAGGVALLVETATDNKNRTAQEVRAIFTRRNGNLGGPGSVSWIFKAKGIVQVPADKATEEAVMEAALDAGAEDVRVAGEFIEVVAGPHRLYAVREALEKASIPVDSAKVSQVPDTMMVVADEKVAQSVLELIEALDEHDDVQNVYANLDVPEDVMARLGSG